MKNTIEYIVDTFTMLGCAKAAADLSRMGYHEEAKRLMLHRRDIQEKREKQKSTNNNTCSVLQ
jgi:hypothetical protein